MTTQEYLDYHRACVEKMHAITKAKNSDYTGDNQQDALSNFTMVEVLSSGVVKTEHGFLTRLTDKFMRITGFIKRGFFSVKDESLEDTLLDLANYCILLGAYYKSKKGKTTTLNCADIAKLEQVPDMARVPNYWGDKIKPAPSDNF